MKLTNSKHRFIYYVEAAPLQEHITSIKNSLLQLNKTYIKRTAQHIPNHYNTNPVTPINREAVLLHLMDQNLHNIMVTEKKIENLFPIHRKSKRALFDGIGKLSNWLFGTMDVDDKVEIENALQTIQENENDLAEQQKWSMSILRTLTDKVNQTFVKIKENQDKIKNRINALNNEVREMAESVRLYQLIQTVNSQISNNNFLLLHFIEELENALTFSTLGILHPSVVSLSDITHINNKLCQLYPPNQILKFENQPSYYAYFGIQNQVTPNKIIFKIFVPLIYPVDMTLYHIYPIPFRNRIISIDRPYLALSETTYLQRTEECPKIENLYICPGEALPTDSNCLIQILNNKGLCPTVPVILKKPLIEQISQSYLIISSPNKTTINYQCTTSGIITISNSTLIQIPKNCKVKFGNNLYYNNPELPIGQQFELPPLEDSPAEEENFIQPLTLDEIKLDDIHKLNQLVQARKIPQLRKISTHHPYANTFAIILILIAIGIVIILKKRQTFCKKRTLPKKEDPQDVPLGPISPRVPF